MEPKFEPRSFTTFIQHHTGGSTQCKRHEEMKVVWIRGEETHHLQERTPPSQIQIIRISRFSNTVKDGINILQVKYCRFGWILGQRYCLLKTC